MFLLSRTLIFDLFCIWEPVNHKTYWSLEWSVNSSILSFAIPRLTDSVLDNAQVRFYRITFYASSLEMLSRGQ